MEGPPPPPPPHGEKPRCARSGGLPDGKYDIFVIPPSSAGSGFLYLPSLQVQRNSFLAGCACTALVFFLYSVAVPVVKEWFHNTIHGGGSGVVMLVLGVGVVAWALGKTQGEGVGAGFTSNPFGSATGSSSAHTDPPPRPPPRSEYERAPPPPSGESTPRPESESTQAPPTPPAPDPEPKPQSPPPKPKSSWQKPQASADGKSAWEKAREETRKREEERKRAAEIQRRRDELEKERQRQREKGKLEQLEREWKEKKAKEEEAAKQAEAEAKVQQAKNEADKAAQRMKEKREREAREALLQAAKEAREAKEALEMTRKEEQERKVREEKEEKERKEAEAKAAETARSAAASNVSARKPPMPSAKTERDDDAYSFRPYDRRKATQKSSSGSVYSEDSYAPSATTARTTPPPSTRGPYTTKDPDKIIVKGVYSFNNAFMRTPISQLISGQGNVTDGLILRITTEGLFIDDDVRGVPQREWDVKAWTMKTAESIELQGHQVLRASIRDQEGKKYVFVMDQTEGWKVAVGLQRLRKGTQVRALGVAGMPANEARILLESLGWV